MWCRAIFWLERCFRPTNMKTLFTYENDKVVFSGCFSKGFQFTLILCPRFLVVRQYCALQPSPGKKWDTHCLVVAFHVYMFWSKVVVLWHTFSVCCACCPIALLPGSRLSPQVLTDFVKQAYKNTDKIHFSTAVLQRLYTVFCWKVLKKARKDWPFIHSDYYTLFLNNRDSFSPELMGECSGNTSLHRPCWPTLLLPAQVNILA